MSDQYRTFAKNHEATNMVFEVTMLETDFDNLVEQVDTTRPVMVDGKEYYKDRAEFSNCTTKDTEQGKTKTCSIMLL